MEGFHTEQHGGRRGFLETEVKKRASQKFEIELWRADHSGASPTRIRGDISQPQPHRQCWLTCDDAHPQPAVSR
jgi:hypothetical protein